MKRILYLFFTLFTLQLSAQDEPFNPDDFEDGSTQKKFCTQKVLNQTPTKLIGIGYEGNLGFTNLEEKDFFHGANKKSQSINSMGGIRAIASYLPISKNNFILSIGASYWASRMSVTQPYSNASSWMNDLYGSRMDVFGINATAFKPLNQKHFLIAQLNTDLSVINPHGTVGLNGQGLTAYGSVLFGWKKGDYRMLALGLSRTYRMGRPLIVPILLYNKTFNDHWGIEALLPARGFVRYNFSTNNMLLGGYELEGQQFAYNNFVSGIGGQVATQGFLQRGEIKPRIAWEKRLKGFFWLSLQVGYRINGRFNLVNVYDGEESNEILVNQWGNSPFFNIGINFVSP
jgi:hypothetical protein